MGVTVATTKQIEANRKNARKSTGPRTAVGKAASAANSLKAGLYARSQITAGEDPPPSAPSPASTSTAGSQPLPKSPSS